MRTLGSTKSLGSDLGRPKVARRASAKDGASQSLSLFHSSYARHIFYMHILLREWDGDSITIEGRLYVL